MINEADRINARISDEAQEISRTRIDLDAFLALKGAARAARWQQWDRAAKSDAIIQQLGRLGYGWDQALVDEWIAAYDLKYGASDLLIPPAEEILAVAQERSELAQRHEDWAGAAQLNRLRVNVGRGARLSWQLGDLLIQSLNTPGAVYAVNRRGCTCPNGRAGKAQCWHIALYDLLLDLQQERADDADDAAQRAELGRRLASARARLIREAA